MTNKFRKKPVVIEAVQVTRAFAIDARLKLEDWISGNNKDDLKSFRYRGDLIEITTLEGVMTAEVGDWIIRGVKGEYYPCKPDIFAATYEAA